MTKGDTQEAPTITVRREPPLGLLIVRSPLKNRGRVFRVEPGQVIGRKDADVLINDRRVSRQHVRLSLTYESGQPVFSLFDFGTPNGTFVNQTRISEWTVVQENDAIQLGDHYFVFKILYP
jgi:pSer/pThr/pTyr-binding forkhead associated (FHA) protein